MQSGAHTCQDIVKAPQPGAVGGRVAEAALADVQECSLVDAPCLRREELQASCCVLNVRKKCNNLKEGKGSVLVRDYFIPT